MKKENLKELFGEQANSSSQLDQEFMDILQNFIFGEVFYAGNLDDKTRELITVIVLTVNTTKNPYSCSLKHRNITY